jgi:hypothetical protein
MIGIVGEDLSIKRLGLGGTAGLVQRKSGRKQIGKGT